MSSAEVIERKNRAFWRRQRDAREFLPAALEILETPASPVGRAIAGTVILFFALAIGWATFGHVDIIATATGKVVPTSRTNTIQPLETGIVSAIHVRDGDKVTAGEVLVELDRTVTQAERRRVNQDLAASLLDVARLSALRRSLDDLAAPHDLDAPAGASEVEIARTRSAMLAQAAEQIAKLASVNQQIDQKRADAQSVTAAIAKIDATLPLLEETATVRKKAMEIQYGNRIAWLDAQTRLVDQQNERIVQERKLVEIEAARRALEQQLAQTRSAFERQVPSDLTDAQKKSDEFKEDFVKAQQKTDEQLLRAPIDGTVQQLAVHTVGGVVTPAQQLMMIVPRDNNIEVEAMISNRDIGFVEAGQDAEIKIDTFNFRDKPADRTAGANQGGALSESSEPTGQELLYVARVSLDGKHMQVENKMVSLAPGMAVTVEIKTGLRRIIEYVLSPLLRYKQESLRER